MPAAAQVSVELNFLPGSDKKLLAELQKLERGIGQNFKFKSNPLGSITADFNKFNDSLEAANARVLAFSASAGGLYAVERAFSSLIKTTINVEKQLADVNVILGVSQKNLGNLSSSLFKIAKDTGQSFTQVVEAAKEFSRQGLGVEETLKRTRDALILTRLTGLDAKSAMEDLTAAVNTFSKAGLTTTQVINKFANVDAAFAVSAADLAESLKRTGSSASDAGVDIDELIALVASLQQTTARGGPVIGNALKSIFARLERPEILDQLQELGIRVREAGQSISAVKVLENLANQYDHLSEAGKNFIDTQIGSLYQINQLKAGLQDLSKENSIYNQALDKARNATEQAITRNEELNKTLAAQLNALKANLTQFGANFGESAVNPALKGFTSISNTLLSSLNKNLSGEETGNLLGKGIADGIGHFLSGPGALLILGVVTKLGARAATDIFKALQIVLGVKEQQILLEREIQAILAKNPEFIKLAQSSAQGELHVRQQILTTLKEQATLQAGLASVSTSITSSALSSGFGVDSKSKNIKIGRFANPLREAINREISSGISPSQVRIGASTQLVSNFNPLGLGVYNTVDEPGGLQQGISRARAEGRNPKTYGVPGFASKYISMFDQINQTADPQFYQKMADAVREGTADGWVKGSVSAMNRTLGAFLGSKITTGLDRDPLTNQLKGGISTIPIIPRNAGLNSLLNPNFPFKTQAGVTSGMPMIQRSEGLEKLLQEQTQLAANFQNEQKKLIQGNKPSFFSSNAAIGLSLVAPIIQGVLKNALGNETLGSRRASGAVDVLGSAVGFGAAGGFLTGGPIGAGAGVALGLLTTLPDVMKSWNSVLPELQKNLDNVTDSFNRTTEDLGKYVTLNEQLSDVYTGKNSVNQSTLRNLERQRGELISKIQSKNPTLLKKLFDSEDGGNLNDVIKEFNQQETLNQRLLQTKINLQKIRENGKVLNDPTRITGFNQSSGVGVGVGFGSLTFTRTQSPIFGKKLDLDSQTQTADFARFLLESKTSVGDKSLFDVFADNTGHAENFEINKKLLNSQRKPEFAKNILEKLSFFFTNNKEISENLDIIKNDTNIERQIEQVNILAQNLPLGAGEIADALAERERFINLVKKNNELILKGTSFVDEYIRNNSLIQLNEQLDKDFNQKQKVNKNNLTNLRNQSLLDVNSNFISNRQNLVDSTQLARSIIGGNYSLGLKNNEQNRESAILSSRFKNLNEFLSTSQQSLNSDSSMAPEIREIRMKRFQEFAGQTDSLGLAELKQKKSSLIIDQVLDKIGLTDSLNSLKGVRENLSIYRNGGATTITPGEIDSQIKYLDSLLTDLTTIESTYNDKKRNLEEDNIQELEELNVKFQKENALLLENLTTSRRKRNVIFSDEYASNRQQILLEKLVTGDNYKPGAALTESFFNEWEYRIKDLYKDLQAGASDLSKSIKGGFKDAISSIIMDSKNAGEAFGNFGRLILSKIVNQSVDRTVDYVFSGIGSLASGFLKKSSGGPVTGGSGMKDDVPALLQGGEYVLRKSAVQQIGVNRLNMLNNGGYLKKYASGGISGLSNTFDKGTGKFLIDPRLSDLALEDTNNPQNALRNILEDEYSRNQAYEYEKQKALRDFKSSRKTAATFALISAGIQAVGAGYQSYKSSYNYSPSSLSNNAFRNTPQVAPGGLGATYAANGGLIRGYANGGGVFGGQSSKDNIPAMLMGGEYVIRKDVVDRYGKPYFDRLNRGVARFAEGGSVGLATTTVDRNNNSEKLIIALNLLSKNLENSAKSNSGNLENNSNINITINMTESGITSENQIVVGNKKEKENKDNSNKIGADNLKQLGQMIKTEVTKILIEEKRAGGLLSPIPR